MYVYMYIIPVSSYTSTYVLDFKYKKNDGALHQNSTGFLLMQKAKRKIRIEKNRQRES